MGPTIQGEVMLRLCHLIRRLKGRSITLFILLSTAITSIQAQAVTPYILIDADSGAVLKQEDADVPWYPASLTKMMTLYLVFEALDQKKVSRKTELSVSAKAATQPQKKLGLELGNTITLEEAMYSVATVSANDSAVVLAEGVSGSTAKFVQSMNKMARKLGMLDTHFTNVTGLPNPEQLTSARDMAILARAIIKDYPQYYPIFSTRSITRNGEVLPTYNAFLNRYEGAEGFKTGYTCGSGYNLVAAAKRQDMRLITVVLGAESLSSRMALATQLMDEGFKITPDAPGLMLVAFRRSVPVSLEPEYVLNRPGCAQF
jgi:D-alanyl-D-alanine carboxypeptidase